MPRPRTTAPVQRTEVQHSEKGSSLKSVIEKVEIIKNSMKDLLREFQQVQEDLKLAEKVKRGTEREIETIRTQLRKIQNVSI